MNPSFIEIHRRKCAGVACWIIWFVLQAIALPEPGASASSETSFPGAAPEAVGRWQDFKLGLFIHWGPVCMTGGEISWCRNGIGGPPNNDADCKNIPSTVYDQLYRSFYPAQFDAREWVRIARQAGMKYLVFTTKHHDGFCLFDSRLTDYKITNTPFKRDVAKELADACHDAGLALGWYYSPPDWHYGNSGEPKPYNRYFHGQIQELCANYGQVDILWFDMAHGNQWEAGQLVPAIRKLQPQVIINDRLGGAVGDFSTREGGIGKMELQTPWESCITIQHYQFSWNPNSRVMPAKEAIHTLIRVVGSGGNLLLNLGPLPTGQLDPSQVSVLKTMGRWLADHGQSVYGAKGGPFAPSLSVAATHHGNKLYVHVLDWFNNSVSLPGLGKKILSGSVLPRGQVLIDQHEDRVELAVPVEQRDEYDTVIELELAGPVEDLTGKIPLNSLSEGKQYSASGFHRNQESLNAEKAFDGDITSRWAAPEDCESCWLAVDMQQPVTFDRIYLHEHARRILRYELEIKDGGQWKPFFKGNRVGEHRLIQFPPVTARELRLEMKAFIAPPTIWEFQVFAPMAGR